MRADGDGVDEEILYILRHLLLRTLYFGRFERQVRLYTVVLTQPEIFVTIYKILQILITLFRNRDDGRCLTRDRIAHISAFYTRQSCFEISYRILEETEQQFDRIRTLQMNIATRVTTLATLYFYLECNVAFFGIYRLIRERSFRVYTTGTTYIQLALGFRIEVEKVFALEPTTLQVIRTIHTGFLINREERLQRRMNGILVCQDSHRCSYTDSVVCTKGRTVRRNPLSVVLDIRLDRIFLKIKDFVAVLLRYHIHVSLEDHTRMVLHAGRRRFANEHVADLVLQRFQTKGFTVIH